MDRKGEYVEKETTFTDIRPLHHSQPMNFSAHSRPSPHRGVDSKGGGGQTSLILRFCARSAPKNVNIFLLLPPPPPPIRNMDRHPCSHKVTMLTVIRCLCGTRLFFNIYNTVDTCKYSTNNYLKNVLDECGNAKQFILYKLSTVVNCFTNIAVIFQPNSLNIVLEIIFDT